MFYSNKTNMYCLFLILLFSRQFFTVVAKPEFFILSKYHYTTAHNSVFFSKRFLLLHKFTSYSLRKY